MATRVIHAVGNLVFNENVCEEALEREILKIMKKNADQLRTMLNAFSHLYPLETEEGDVYYPKFSVTVVKNYFGGDGSYHLVVKNAGSIWAAMIMEHGSGSLMDSEDENPDLVRYKQSGYWNKYRRGNAIVGRPKGTYRTIGGKFRYKKDNAGMGKNVERRFEPREPQHLVRDSINSQMIIVKYQLMECVTSFPYTSYIMGGAR